MMFILNKIKKWFIMLPINQKLRHTPVEVATMLSGLSEILT